MNQVLSIKKIQMLIIMMVNKKILDSPPRGEYTMTLSRERRLNNV
jgi:hypothetical protein